ncbi:MAG: polysaccharide biosynthesis tyrosine autokinase [Myxococcota bacterium]|nr:polysaccharide biosynthesis tyrosine autokinase [Myxococcota bacterium]
MSDTRRQPHLQSASVIPPPPSKEPEEQGVDLWEYLGILRRHYLLIALCALLAVGLAAFVTLRMTKIYRATATLRIETQAPRVLGNEVENVVEMGTGSFWSNVEYYETQYKIIESRDVASRVVAEFKLNEDKKFMEVPEDKLVSWKGASVDEAAGVLQGMLNVEPVKDSRIVRVHIDSAAPKQAQMLVNAVVRAYRDKNLESMLQSTVDAVDWLSKQLDQAREELSAAETAAYEYKKSNDILSISLDERQNILASQMQTAATKLTEATAKRIEVQARKSAIASVVSSKDPMAIPLDSLNASSLIQNLKQSYGQLSQEYGELSERYGDSYPKMVEIKAKMERIRQDISREVRNILSAVDAELNAARGTEAGLQAALNEMHNQAMDLSHKEVSYNRFERDRENAKHMYELLIGRSKEADLSRLLRVNNVEMLDSALEPLLPIKPRLKVNLALALALGLLLGIGLAVLREFADRTIKTQEQVESLGLAFLGIVPSIDSSTSGSSYSTAYGRGHNKKRAPKVEPDKDQREINFDVFVHEYPKSQVAESCRAIRTNLLFMTTDQPARHILVTSPSPQEGKTTVAINLAIVMAQSGSRVLLVDTDMRRPRVHRAFGIKSRKGVSTMVLGESTMAESVVHTHIPNLDVLPCGTTPPNPAELIHTESFQKVLAELSRHYDRIVFDSPPVGVVTDAAVLSKFVDGTVLIVKSQQTTRDAAAYAVGTLRDIGANILGSVLNDLDLMDRKYGRHYYQYYYRKNGGYYEAEGEGRDTGDPRQAAS